jgi:hypothetical protein
MFVFAHYFSPEKIFCFSAQANFSTSLATLLNNVTSIQKNARESGKIFSRKIVKLEHFG